MLTTLENVASADLFNEIVAAIAGNGWDIEYDGRNSASGPYDVTPWPTGHQDLGATLGNEGASTYARMPKHLVKEGGLTRVSYTRSNSTGGNNPILKAFPGYSSTVNLASYPPSSSTIYRFSCTPVKMFNDKYWFLHAGYRSGSTSNPYKFIAFFGGDTPVSSFSENSYWVTFTNDNFITNRSGSTLELLSTSNTPLHIYNQYTHVLDINSVLLFSPAAFTDNTVRGERILTTYINVTAEDLAGQQADVVASAEVREFLTLSDIPPTAISIRAVTGIVEETSRYVVYVAYYDSVTEAVRTCRVFVTNKDLFNPVLELDPAPVFNNDYYYVAPIYGTDNEFFALQGSSAGAPENLFLIRTKPETAGLPDSNDLHYEAVIFKNTSNTRFALLQPDPNQVSPPATAPITTNKPIFVRPIVLDKNESVFSLARFKFDPVKTGLANTIAPALYTELTPGTPQTFTGWVSADADGFYVHTESSGTSEVQVLGASLTKPLIGSNPNAEYYDQPFNLICYSAGKTGVIDAVGTSFNGYTVTLEPRGVGTGSYLPRAHMVSYSSALTQENETDNKVYGFPVYWVHNPSNYGTAAVASDSFFFGEDTRLRFISEGSGVTQGQEVFTTHKVSLIPTAVDDNDAVVLKRLAVKQ